MSDPAEAGVPSDDGHVSEDQVGEELLTPPRRHTPTEFHGDVESELEGDFTFVPLVMKRLPNVLTLIKSQLRRKNKTTKLGRFMGFRLQRGV